MTPPGRGGEGWYSSNVGHRLTARPSPGRQPQKETLGGVATAPCGPVVPLWPPAPTPDPSQPPVPRRSPGCAIPRPAYSFLPPLNPSTGLSQSAKGVYLTFLLTGIQTIVRITEHIFLALSNGRPYGLVYVQILAFFCQSPGAFSKFIQVKSKNMLKAFL